MNEAARPPGKKIQIMDALLDMLQGMGCDIDGAMPRFLHKEDLYRRCYKKFLDDRSFVALGEALQAKKSDEAFRHAHILQGMMANMGLTPLLNILLRIVEPLRQGCCDDSLLPAYVQLLTELKKYKILAKRAGD